MLSIKISIITATYNAGDQLHNLIKSVANIKGTCVEFIVIDGSSKDHTVQILRERSDVIDFWLSEPDNGIYDAWNKGVKLATGDWIMFLGADDILLPGAISKYIDFINKHPGKESLEFVSSRVQMIDKEGKPIWINGWRWQWPNFLRKMTIAHPGALHSRSLFTKYGLFDTSYKITADYELLLRPRHTLKAAFLDEITVAVTEGGVSDSYRAIKEHYCAAVKTGGSSRLIAKFYGEYAWMKTKLNRAARKCGVNLNISRVNEHA